MFAAFRVNSPVMASAAPLKGKYRCEPGSMVYTRGRAHLWRKGEHQGEAGGRQSGSGAEQPPERYVIAVGGLVSGMAKHQSVHSSAILLAASG